MTKRMKKLTDEQKRAARVWVDKFAALGFLGREALNFTRILAAIGYEGSPQSLSKWWIKTKNEMFAASPQKEALEALEKELADAIESQKANKEGNENG